MEESKVPEQPQVPDKDTLMKQYQMMVDVHKFYFEIVLKFLIFLRFARTQSFSIPSLSTFGGK